MGCFQLKLTHVEPSLVRSLIMHFWDVNKAVRAINKMARAAAGCAGDGTARLIYLHLSQPQIELSKQQETSKSGSTLLHTVWAIVRLLSWVDENFGIVNAFPTPKREKRRKRKECSLFGCMA